jgi:hypothetical protein
LALLYVNVKPCKKMRIDSMCQCSVALLHIVVVAAQRQAGRAGITASGFTQTAAATAMACDGVSSTLGNAVAVAPCMAPLGVCTQH